MKEYFVALVSIVFVGGMMVSLTPSGSLQKYMRFLCGLAVCGCIMMPLLSGELFENIDPEEFQNYWESVKEETQKYDEIYNMSLKNAGIKNSEEYLKNLIIKELLGDESDIDVCIITNESSDEIYIECVEVIIYPSGVTLDPRKVQNIVYELLECECIIRYDIVEK